MSDVVKMNMQELTQLVLELQARIEKLETPKNVSQREMTDEDARNIMFGELKSLKHKEAAEKLGLSYGQIYSCRLGFTFKAIHKEMKEKSIPNEWMK